MSQRSEEQSLVIQANQYIAQGYTAEQAYDMAGLSTAEGVEAIAGIDGGNDYFEVTKIEYPDEEAARTATVVTIDPTITTTTDGAGNITTEVIPGSTTTIPAGEDDFAAPISPPTDATLSNTEVSVTVTGGGTTENRGSITVETAESTALREEEAALERERVRLKAEKRAVLESQGLSPAEVNSALIRDSELNAAGRAVTAKGAEADRATTSIPQPTVYKDRFGNVITTDEYNALPDDQKKNIIATSSDGIVSSDDPAAAVVDDDPFNENEDLDEDAIADFEAAEEAAEEAAFNAAIAEEAANNAISQEEANKENDWRVRLHLAPSADYLYRSANPGILKPLADTEGLIFPYTPTIAVQYNADYENYDLVHSNYRGYFYKGSQVQNILVTATFTANDLEEANYLLAALHFLRSATKMFYGKDKKRGMPPPVVFLTGLGEFQFNNHPCAVTMMNYNLPNDVDYIPCGNPAGIQPTPPPPSNPTDPSLRLGTQVDIGGTVPVKKNNNGEDDTYSKATYVPTKIDISFTMIPIQTREQVSNEFSLEEYASGSLLKKGFW